MDDDTPAPNGYVRPGVSIRYGPVDGREVEMQDVEANGTGQIKRKSRGMAGVRKSYAEESSEDDDIPLVCHVSTPFFQRKMSRLISTLLIILFIAAIVKN